MTPERLRQLREQAHNDPISGDFLFETCAYIEHLLEAKASSDRIMGEAFRALHGKIASEREAYAKIADTEAEAYARRPEAEGAAAAEHAARMIAAAIREHRPWITPQSPAKDAG